MQRVEPARLRGGHDVDDFGTVRREEKLPLVGDARGERDAPGGGTRNENPCKQGGDEDPAQHLDRDEASGSPGGTVQALHLSNRNQRLPTSRLTG